MTVIFDEQKFYRFKYYVIFTTSMGNLNIHHTMLFTDKLLEKHQVIWQKYTQANKKIISPGRK